MKIYGPYKRFNDGRWIIIIDGKTKSYPRYLLEQYLGRELKLHEEADHIDGNPDNNELSNLRVLHKSFNAAQAIQRADKTKIYTEAWKEKQRIAQSGQRNGMSKITQEQVNNYRKEYEAAGLKKFKNQVKKRIILETGMTRKAVENFLNYISYKN